MEVLWYFNMSNNQDYNESLRREKTKEQQRAFSQSPHHYGILSGFAFGRGARIGDFNCKFGDPPNVSRETPEVIKDVEAVDVTDRAFYLPPPIST